MINTLSLEEKMRLLIAKGGFSTQDLNGKVSKIEVSDGPCGVRRPNDEYPNGIPSFCYPAPHVLANSWDREIVYKIGQSIASDCIEQGYDILLAPGVNIKRTPLCGRNFEYFSEDPILAGELAAEYIKGCQDKGIGVSLKHFCANNSEWDRLWISNEIDLRTLREIYVKVFEIVLSKVEPYTVMCAYNAVNGVNCAENKGLLNDILRERLGYKGVIVSDWGAVHNRAESLKASLDIMFFEEESGYLDLKRAYEDGFITEEEIDVSVNRILALIEKVSKTKEKRIPISTSERYENAFNAAINGMVLLKNKDNVLPLQSGKICLLGDMCVNPARCGGGAGGVSQKGEIPSLKQALKKYLPQIDVEYEMLYANICPTSNPANEQITNIPKALDLVYDSDVTVMVVGSSSIVETESYDRASIRLSDKIEKLILEVSKNANKLVVVVESGSAIDMSAWIDCVDAVLYTGFCGDVINDAIAGVLLGKYNPSGRLSETFPLSKDNDFIKKGTDSIRVDRYSEGCLVGYRYYDTKGVDVLFPFGYGLSYAEYKYSNFTIEEKGEYEYVVGCDVENVSNKDGDEVVQLYVRQIDHVLEKPNKELKRFKKIKLNGKEKKRVEFNISKDCFESFNVWNNDWFIPKGRYELLIARNVRDIEHCYKIKV